MRSVLAAMPVLVVLLGVGPTPADATVLLPVTFDEMVAGSQIVVYGRVADVRSRLTDGRRTIESVVTLDVIDALKGPAGRVVAFRVPVGQVGRYRRVMMGVPTFNPGDEVIVFLEGHAPAVPVPFGLSQGVYRVSYRANGAALVTEPPHAGDRAVRGDPALRPLALGAFTARVRQAAVERAR